MRKCMLFVFIVPLLCTTAAPARGATPGVRAADIVPGVHTPWVVAPHGFFQKLAEVRAAARGDAAHAAAGVPSFSRQTGLPCSACHYQFPQLTPFGRLFKLNGYTLTGLKTIGEPGDTTGRREALKLSPIPPVAGMFVVSGTRTRAAQPGAQNTTTELPQEASIFFAGQLTPSMGLFTQFTYAGADGTIGIDNVDLRYATRTSAGDRDLLVGVTLHNNPTVQDVWNTVPAWGYPFMSSEVAPSPIASTLIDGGLEQQVLGLGVYALFDNVLYAEATAYRSAPQGTTLPQDSTATNTTSGAIPYWRLALQHQEGSTYVMLGTYGFSANLYPQGVSGKTNRYTDIGVDAQVERGRAGRALIGRATYIRERQHLTAFMAETPAAAERLEPTLSTVRASVGVVPSERYGLDLGYFRTTGSRDTLLFAPAVLTGSRTGSPNTSGEIGELTYNPWENARLGVQYVRYDRFNGASAAYDVPGGRRASANNTLYLYTWLAF